MRIFNVQEEISPDVAVRFLPILWSVRTITSVHDQKILGTFCCFSKSIGWNKPKSIWFFCWFSDLWRFEPAPLWTLHRSSCQGFRLIGNHKLVFITFYCIFKPQQFLTTNNNKAIYCKAVRKRANCCSPRRRCPRRSCRCATARRSHWAAQPGSRLGTSLSLPLPRLWQNILNKMWSWLKRLD